MPQGIFVCLVIPGSPAAMAGLRFDFEHLLVHCMYFTTFRFLSALINRIIFRFGDQLLTLGRTALAGMTSDAVHCRYLVGFHPFGQICISLSSSLSGFGVAP